MHADRGADAEPPAVVLAGVRVAVQLVDVLDRDQALQVEVAIDQQELLDLVAGEDAVGLFEGGVLGRGDEVALGHDLLDAEVVGLQEPEVAAGEDALELAADGDGDARDVVPFHDQAGFADHGVGAQGDRVDDDAVFGALDLVDLEGLLLDRHVLVDDAEAAFLGQGDGQLALGDGVHRGGQDRAG